MMHSISIASYSAALMTIEGIDSCMYSDQFENVSFVGKNKASWISGMRPSKKLITLSIQTENMIYA